MSNPNPYESPAAPESIPIPKTPPVEKRGVALSVFMMLAGAFFCVVSFYVLLGSRGKPPSAADRFAIAYMAFYGYAGALTSGLHLSYLIWGRPKQALAGIYAMAMALGLTLVTMALWR